MWHTQIDLEEAQRGTHTHTRCGTRCTQARDTSDRRSWRRAGRSGSCISSSQARVTHPLESGTCTPVLRTGQADMSDTEPRRRCRHCRHGRTVRSEARQCSISSKYRCSSIRSSTARHQRFRREHSETRAVAKRSTRCHIRCHSQRQQACGCMHETKTRTRLRRRARGAKPRRTLAR